MRFEDISLRDEVIVVHPVTKQQQIVRVIDKNKDTDEVLIVIADGCGVWRKAFDIVAKVS
jgi:hypothetical protein